MDAATATNFLNMFETLQCPYVQDIELSYLSELLLTPSRHRTRILCWLFSSIDPDLENMIDSCNVNQGGFMSSHEIDSKIQLLTGIASDLCLCIQDDFDLIRGKATARKQIAFWGNLLSVAANISDHNKEQLYEHDNEICTFSKAVLRTCDISTVLSLSLQLLSCSVQREISVTLKTIKTSKSISVIATEDVVNTISKLESQLSRQKDNITKLLKEYSYKDFAADETSKTDKLNRSLRVVLNDLCQLQTTFLQTHENFFQPYCDKTPVTFNKFGQTLHKVNCQLKSYLQLIDTLKNIKETNEEISNPHSAFQREAWVVIGSTSRG
ncbi:HAUS augmin-like complex subunit 7 [Clavelina lepadiformis]|uniref:HAUS augmin-like complex subunit 7 n=1 Tax=Clavelina lepadiformis TaxID=159417 RepID=A0ABP0EWJ7_CLALP